MVTQSAVVCVKERKKERKKEKYWKDQDVNYVILSIQFTFNNLYADSQMVLCVVNDLTALFVLYHWFNKGIPQVQAEELASLSESD